MKEIGADAAALAVFRCSSRNLQRRTARFRRNPGPPTSKNSKIARCFSLFFWGHAKIAKISSSASPACKQRRLTLSQLGIFVNPANTRLPRLSRLPALGGWRNYHSGGGYG